MIATTLLVVFGNSMWIAAYIAVANILTWFSINALKESSNTDLDAVA